MRAVGFPAASLHKKQKWTLEQLKEAGFSAADVRSAADCSPAELEALGFNEQQIRSAGFSPEQLAGEGGGLCRHPFAGAAARTDRPPVGRRRWQVGCLGGGLGGVRSRRGRAERRRVGIGWRGDDEC